jgi:hypothetical protein
MMKKSARKLTIRRDTLRVLAELDLARVAGGNDEARQIGTEGPNTTCVVQAARP